MGVFHLLAGVLTLCIVSHGSPIEEDLKRMGEYELNTFEFEFKEGGFEPSISFTAFDNKYELVLERNDGIIGSQITNHKGEISTPDDEFSQLTESCHYHVRFKDGTTKGGYGGVSLCPGRGVRARLVGFGDTLIIRPAKYYLNYKTEPNVVHDINDDHMMYLMSDYDDSDIPLAKGKSVNMDDNANDHKDSSLTKNILSGHGDHDNKKHGKKSGLSGLGKQFESLGESIKRKLLGGSNNVGLYVICDDSMYQSYYNTYGSSWESQLKSEATDWVNDVNSEYYGTSWGSTIGTIRVTFSKFDALTSFSGTFASLYPDYSSSSQIDGDGYLSLLKTWSANYVDYDEIDNVQIWTKYSFDSGAAGWGWTSTIYDSGYVFVAMCSTSGYSTSNNVLNYGYDWGVRTMNHEMGHNFGAPHDQDTPCGVNGGLMGYGSGEGFSSCSIGYIEDVFAQNKYDCLLDGASTTTGTTTSDDDSDDDDSGDDNDYDCSYYSCLTLWDISYWTSSYNMVMSQCYNGNAVYYDSSSGLYLYKSATYTNYWFLNTEIHDTSTYAYCSGQSDPTNCGGSWMEYNNGWVSSSGLVYSGYCTSSANVITASGNGAYTDGSGTDSDTDDDGHDHTYSSNCTLTYGDSVCMYNDGSLWSAGIATFDFYLCKDDIAMYKYNYKTENTSTMYFLHYESFDDTNIWLISKTSINDLSGEAFCTETSLSDCSYDTWYVRDSSETDQIVYDLSNSMGYDSNCENSLTDDDESYDSYCERSDACALWSVEFTIEDTSESTDLCSDTYGGCISLILSSDFSNVNTYMDCDGSHSIDVKFNVSFSSNAAYSSYDTFINSYESIFDTCDDDTELAIELISSNLTVCDDCSFSNSQDNDSSARGRELFAGVAFLMAMITFMAL